jgi:hypothetical protein
VAKPLKPSGRATHVRRQQPAKDPLMDEFFRLNEQFGEVVDGRVLGPEDYVTDPDELAEYPQPTDEEVREHVRKGLANARPRSRH